MATFTFSLTIGATTAEETLTVPDARAVEFLDLLRTLRYSQNGVNVPTRAQAASRFAAEAGDQVRIAYRQLKEQEARLNRSSQPDFDITS